MRSASLALFLPFFFWGCSAGDSAVLSLYPGGRGEDQGSEGPEEGTGAVVESAGAPGQEEAPGREDVGDGGSNSNSAEDDDCESPCDPEEPICSQGECVECVGAADCGQDEACDIFAHECEDMCFRDSDCDEGLCHSENFCVECLADEDCLNEGPAFVCNEGECEKALED